MHTVVVWKMFGDMAVTLVRKAVNEFNFAPQIILVFTLY